jgi:ELWxxDGT repeat protein
MGQVPYQVKVINPTYSASIRDAVGMNGIGYFVAGSYLNFSNGQWDEELWRTDGTEAGTYRVKDIRVGQAGSNIKWMTVVGSTLYFSANDGTSGDELWKSDGTEAGTVRVVELSVGSGGGNLQSLVDYNGALHFIGTYANGSTYLFRSDGTAAGTVPVSTAVTPYAPTSINPDRRLTVWNGYLWFMGTNTSFTSSGLYRSDGTSAGTTLITTLDSPGSDMVAATNQLFFTANDPTYRREVWRSDGTAAGTYMTKDLNPINSGFNGSSSAWIYWTVGNVVLFSGVDGNPGFNRKLYRSDGTVGGTYLLADIYPGFSDVTNGPRTNADRTYMIWESRQQGGSSAPHLYTTDGTVAGTIRLKTFLSFCQNFMAMDGVMYFRASDGSAAGGAELWRTNGTVAGTYRYADINPGPNGSDPYPVGFFGNLGLLHAGPSYPQLWAFRLCNSSPQPAVSFAPSAVCAGNGAGTASVTNAASFTSFSWTIVNGAFDSPANGSSVSFHATSSNDVQLTVTVTAVDVCQQQATVTVPTVAAPPATITPSGPTTFCEGGSVTLTAPSGMASYLWSNGETTQAITVSAGGNYTVTVSNSSGCSATSSATPVTVNPLPSGMITPSGPTTFCEGGSVTLTAPGGMSSYSWSTGATTQAITVNATGNYDVTFTNANGCSSTVGVPVQVNPSPAATITAGGPTTFCEGGSVTLTAGAAEDYS